jgi:DNA-binding NarL/FixJ family response regulator
VKVIRNHPLEPHWPRWRGLAFGVAPYGVVVADHWPLVRIGIGRALPSLSFRVLEEADGAPALRRAVSRRAPDLVVLGNHLGEDPVPVVESLAVAGVRCLVLLEDPNRVEVANLARAGAEGILSGSASAEELSSAAQRVMAGERALSPQLVSALAGLNEERPVRPEVPDLLTRRELEVLERLVQGARTDEIAKQLFLSPATVKAHLSRIYMKLEVRGRHEATARAVQLGLAHP